MIQKKLRGNKFVPGKASMTLDVISRYLSTGFSFILLLFLVNLMTIKDFALFQVGYSFAGMIIWLGDFGLGISLITVFAQKNLSALKQIWSLRLILLSFTFTLFSFLGSSFIPTFNYLFFMTAFLDMLSDSHLSLRQLAAKNKFELFIQPLKRGIQLIGLFLVSILNPGNSNLYILLVLTLPSAIMIFFDSVKFGGRKLGNIKQHMKDSSARWFQSGGTALSNLDNVILGLGNHFTVIATLAITKKLFNALGILGTALFPKVLFEVASKRDFNNGIFRIIQRTIDLVFIPTILIVILLPNIFGIFWDIEISSGQLLMSQIFMLLLPIILFCVAFNSVLLGLNLNRQAAISTYLAGVVYITILSFSLLEINVYFLVVIASVFHALVWLLSELFFVKKATNFRFIESLLMNWNIIGSTSKNMRILVEDKKKHLKK